MAKVSLRRVLIFLESIRVIDLSKFRAFQSRVDLEKENAKIAAHNFRVAFDIEPKISKEDFQKTYRNIDVGNIPVPPTDKKIDWNIDE